MLVLVTGGTGYLGARIVATLHASGHDVRLLVRRRGQVATSLAPYGLGPHVLERVDLGDVLDPVAVVRAVSGCDAVVHAAAVYSLDPRRVREVLETNERAAELVLASACAQGLDPVVHISSFAALTRMGGTGPDLPLGDIELPYCRSKVASERVARRLQDEGHPVVTVYPGAVLGPHDPYRGDQSERLRWQALGRFPIWARGAFHVVDVRTVADVVLAVLEPGRGPRRYVVPGTHADAATVYGTLARVQGRRRPYVTPPTAVLRVMSRFMGAVQRPLPRRLQAPTDLEGVELTVRDNRFDDSPARTELGVVPVPFEQSVRDTLAWMVEAGRLPRRLGPRQPQVAQV
jgi:nucleoside-diphosphate-sugar epimerase